MNEQDRKASCTHTHVIYRPTTDEVVVEITRSVDAVACEWLTSYVLAVAISWLLNDVPGTVETEARVGR